MFKSHEWLAGGTVGETLTPREVRDVASIWVGEAGERGATAAAATDAGGASSPSIDRFGRVVQQGASAKL